MRLLSRAICAIVVTLIATPHRAGAQTPLGVIAGRVVEAKGQPVAGASISAESPNLQGTRTTVSSADGDFLLPGLPPGSYTVRFESRDLQPRTTEIGVDPGQTTRLDVALSSVPLQEVVEVEGRIPQVALATTVQQGITFNQSLMSALPTTRTLDAALSLAPNVHLTGPFGAPSISGAMAFESLFLVDGGVVNDTIRGQPLGLYIEDAVQETSVLTSAISAEYGRLTGGAVNLVTRSGGNQFSGSFRDTLTNDRWRSLTPFAGDTRTNDVISSVEFTAGGPIIRNSLWFFGAGRSTGSEQERTALTVPYTLSDRSVRYEGKLTYAVAPSHSITTTFTGISQETKNTSFSTAIDVRSLYDRQVPQSLFSVRYNGALSTNLALEAGVSARRLSIDNEGARTTELVEGTLLIDRIRNRRYWSPTFCGICDSDRRQNNTAFIKLTSFIPTERRGAHQVVAGYDMFNDIRAYNNHQSGSDYRILGTTAIIEGAAIYPVFAADGSTIIQYNPIDNDTQGTDFRIHSLFANDSWTLDPHWTFNLGLRWDKNHGKDAADQIVSTTGSLSPRLGVAWDPSGSGQWAVTASASRYVDALANVIADSAAPAGRSTTYQWEYRGRPINVDGIERTTPDAAIGEVFNWFNSNGGSNLPIVSADIPGVATRVSSDLESPSATEYAFGVSRTIGRRAVVRIDAMHRAFHNPYVTRADTATGTVTDAFGKPFDLRLAENTNQLERTYRAMTVSATYHPGAWLEAGGNYTLSHLRGNFEGEDTTGPVAATTFTYPEYKLAAWSSPEGDLSSDQRHRASAWAVYQVPRIQGLSLGLVERITSGVPYSAAGLVDARTYVTNPGYVTPQGGSSQRYYYTARDAFRTGTSYRTDLSVNYSYALPLGSRRANLFVQAQLLNVFNEFAIVNPAGISTSVLDPVVASTRFARFDPLTAVPVEGVNWAKGPTFGQPTSVTAYNLPRVFLISFGVRF